MTEPELPAEPHPGETWADVGMRRLARPTHWDMVDAEQARMGNLVAVGGWCAPASSWYDLVDRTPWTHPDLPWCWEIDIDRWLFPRLAGCRAAVARFRQRCAAARAAFTADPDPEREFE